MKTKNKFFIAVIAMVAVLGTTFSSQALMTTVVNGPAYTNATVLVGTNTLQNGVVAAVSTNYYNLAKGSGVQVNTNAWPSAYVSAQGGFPGALGGPSRYEQFYINSTGTGTIPIVFAGTVDGSNFVTNFLTINYPAGSPYMTNVDLGALPGLGLYSVANTNAATAVSNLLIEVSGKPGI